MYLKKLPKSILEESKSNFGFFDKLHRFRVETIFVLFLKAKLFFFSNKFILVLLDSNYLAALLVVLKIYKYCFRTDIIDWILSANWVVLGNILQSHLNSLQGHISAIKCRINNVQNRKVSIFFLEMDDDDTIVKDYFSNNLKKWLESTFRFQIQFKFTFFRLRKVG